MDNFNCNKICFNKSFIRKQYKKNYNDKNPYKIILII